MFSCQYSLGKRSLSLIICVILFGSYSSKSQADTSPTEVLCKVLLPVAACRKENGLVMLSSSVRQADTSLLEVLTMFSCQYSLGKRSLSLILDMLVWVKSSEIKVISM
jgi:hypothetical protein